MPVHGRLQVAFVRDVDHDLGSFRDFQRRPRDRPVVGEHPHGVASELLGHGSDAQIDDIPVGQLDHVHRVGSRVALGFGRKCLAPMRTPSVGSTRVHYRLRKPV